MSDLIDDEQALQRAYDIAARLAAQCADLKARQYPMRGAGMDDVVNALTTQLLEQGFSQIEIRRAFHNALAELDRDAGPA